MKLSEDTRLLESLHDFLQQCGYHEYSLLLYDYHPCKWTELINRCPDDWSEAIEHRYDNHVYLSQFFKVNPFTLSS